MYKFQPILKSLIWGGEKIAPYKGIATDQRNIGESWELSAHPDGQSRIADGRYKGMLFNDYLSIIGKEALGWKCQAQDRFPVLIKFIDAKQALSIGVEGVLDQIPTSDCCYVTIDIDSFDIPYAPGTGSPVPGGLDYSYITNLLEGIAEKCNVIGFDLVEVAPQYDPAGITPRIAALTILSFIGFIYEKMQNR